MRDQFLWSLRAMFVELCLAFSSMAFVLVGLSIGVLIGQGVTMPTGFLVSCGFGFLIGVCLESFARSPKTIAWVGADPREVVQQ